MKLLTAIGFWAWLFVASTIIADPVSAQVVQTTPTSGVGYYPYVIARPGDRQWIRNMPIEQRPTRPLHVYGNFVRKGYTVRPTGRIIPVSRPKGMPLLNRRF